MAKLRNYIAYGLHADRPAAGAPGALYFESDTGKGYRDNGTSWDLIANSAGGLPLIRAFELAEDAADITFDPIPPLYSALQLDLEGRSTAPGHALEVLLQMNGDTADSYDYQEMDTDGATPEGANNLGVPALVVAQIPGTDATAGVAGGARIYVPNYAGTTFHKRVQTTGGLQQGFEGDPLQQWHMLGYWHSTAAITQLVLTTAGASFLAGTTARLYGVP